MKKYSIIYADPPWAYRTYSKKGQGRSAESHYPTMCIEDIKALPVGELAAKDCALFLWITFPCLCEALEVLTAWGFSYKTVAFVWVKQNRKNDDLFTGMGYWTRANAEICILATKGHPKRVDAGVRQVILSHIEEHSKKPDEARERIVRLMGDLLPRRAFCPSVSRRLGRSGGHLDEVEMHQRAKNACSFLSARRQEWGWAISASKAGKEETVNGICSGPEGS